MGDYDLLNSTDNLLIPLITLQIFDTTFRWMIRGEDADGEYAKSAMQIVAINSLIAAGIVFIISKTRPFNYATEFVWLLFCKIFSTSIFDLYNSMSG